MKVYKGLMLGCLVLFLTGCESVNYFSVGEYMKKVVIAMFGEEPDPAEVQLYFNENFSELIDYPSIQHRTAIEAVQQFRVEGTEMTVEDTLTYISDEILWFAMIAKNSTKLQLNFEEIAHLKNYDTVVLVRNDFVISVDFYPHKYDPPIYKSKEFYFLFIVSKEDSVRLFEPKKPEFGKVRYKELHQSIVAPEDEYGVLLRLLHNVFESNKYAFSPFSTICFTSSLDFVTSSSPLKPAAISSSNKFSAKSSSTLNTGLMTSCALCHSIVISSPIPSAS